MIDKNVQVFLDSKRILLIEYLQKGKTNNSEYIILGTFNNLDATISKKGLIYK